jgi:phosphonate transport system substrate-binding protein
MHRRRFLGYSLAAGCGTLTPRFARSDGAQPLSIGTTPVFLDDDVAFLRDWQAYLQRELGRPVVFVQRRSYREVSELLLAEKLDSAWICGFPYVRYRDRMRLLAVPTYEGEPLYRSYVIVPSSDQTTQSIADLGGSCRIHSCSGSAKTRRRSSARASLHGAIAGSLMRSPWGWRKEVQLMGTSGTR